MNLFKTVGTFGPILPLLALATSLPLTAPAESRPTKASAAATPSKQMAHQIYTSYFESNASGLKGDSSYLVLPTQSAFDKVFGAAAVMGENSFLPENAFQSQMVAAVIKRGNRTWTYTIQQVQAKNGTLSISYNATPSAPSGVTFASPLILSVDEGNYNSVKFIENGKAVATITNQVVTKPSVAKANQIKVFLVAVGDNGQVGKKFGCEDSLVPVTRTVAPTKAPLNAALHTLLSLPRTYPQNPKLENFWKGRNLRLQSVAVRQGVATIVISGEVFVAGVCDQPRITEQIEATALQFPQVKKVKVFIGKSPLAEAIS